MPTIRHVRRARGGANVTKDIRVTLEGMLVNEQSLAGSEPSAITTGLARTVGANLGVVKLDGAVVYAAASISGFTRRDCRWSLQSVRVRRWLAAPS